MTLDLDRLRAETPGVANRIHLNNAGAGLMPAPVIAALKDHIDLEAAIGGYEAEEREAARLEGVYDSIARLIGARRDEIALTENATVAWDLAFYAFDFAPGDRILTARAEYAANYIAYLQVAQRTGAVIEVVPDDADGVLDPVALEAMIDGRVKLISITWIPTNGGLVNPAAEVGRVARAAGVPFLLDACQSVGQMPIDVASTGTINGVRGGTVIDSINSARGRDEKSSLNQLIFPNISGSIAKNSNWIPVPVVPTRAKLLKADVASITPGRSRSWSATCLPP
ncbi:MAG: aminotransferase class V-fold PLP-dependent enzyme [Proteobacteria bacterium]|nr:aminotransferase class V-fold PLP-dependent enzyme [Pseudomonadota bacterium]